MVIIDKEKPIRDNEIALRPPPGQRPKTSIKILARFPIRRSLFQGSNRSSGGSNEFSRVSERENLWRLQKFNHPETSGNQAGKRSAAKFVNSFSLWGEPILPWIFAAGTGKNTGNDGRPVEFHSRHVEWTVEHVGRRICEFLVPLGHHTVSTANWNFNFRHRIQHSRPTQERKFWSFIDIRTGSQTRWRGDSIRDFKHTSASHCVLGRPRGAVRDQRRAGFWLGGVWTWRRLGRRSRSPDPVESSKRHGGFRRYKDRGSVVRRRRFVSR